MKKYAVFAGLVPSAHDRDMHWISAAQLMRLYGVPPKECVAVYVEGGGLLSPGMRGRHGRSALSGLIHLRPRYAGDYREWLKLEKISRWMTSDVDPKPMED